MSTLVVSREMTWSLKSLVSDDQSGKSDMQLKYLTGTMSGGCVVFPQRRGRRVRGHILPQVANIKTKPITAEPNYMQISDWTTAPGNASSASPLMGNKQMRAVSGGVPLPSRG